LGKAASLAGDITSAEKIWTKVIAIEKGSDLAAQAHFALAALYRKEKRIEDAEREMREFQKLQNTTTVPEGPQKQ
jgi:Tfp pilus assembly protein PilF